MVKFLHNIAISNPAAWLRADNFHSRIKYRNKGISRGMQVFVTYPTMRSEKIKKTCQKALTNGAIRLTFASFLVFYSAVGVSEPKKMDISGSLDGILSKKSPKRIPNLNRKK